MEILSSVGFFSLTLATFLLILLRKFFGSIIFHPFIMPILTFCVSLGTVITLFLSGQIVNSVFIFLAFSFSLFIVAFILLPVLGLSISNTASKYAFSFCLKPIDFKFLNLIFLVAILLTSIYVVALWSEFDSGDDRLILNRNLRALAILQELSLFWAVILSSAVYALTRGKKYLFYFTVLIFLSLFSGSKGASVSYFLWFCLFYFNFNFVSAGKRIIFLTLVFSLLFIPTFLMYEDVFYKIIHRVSMSGDVYLYSFMIGDYRELYGVYEPFHYLMHPFTALFGYRGYEYPFGAELMGTIGREVTGTGPNAHLTMLALTFFPDNVFVQMIFMIGMVCLFIFTVSFSFWFLKLSIFNFYFRILLFSMLLSASFSLFFDIGIYQMKVVYSLLAFLIYISIVFILEACKVRPERSRKSLNYKYYN